MSKFHDDTTAASDSVKVGLSLEKLRRLEPALFGWRSVLVKYPWGEKRLNASQIKGMISEHLSFGDSRAAVCVMTTPRLIVAAFTDEQDAVLLLDFPMFLVDEHGLKSGAKLLTVNTYGRGKTMASDIVEGPASLGHWMNFYPLIAEFLSEDLEVIAGRKNRIADVEWKRTVKFAQALMSRPEVSVRDGRPLQSAKVGTRVKLR